MATATYQEQQISKKTRFADRFLAAGIVFVLMVLLVPLPQIVMDLMLTFTFAFAFTIMMVTIYNEKPTDFSVFPSMLLFVTLFRLSINVATTRLILLDAEAGSVINAFGEFVVGGSYVVGVVIFSIIVAINFMVITKGSGRISEVAARFTLDAMPGKQMAIDADLNSGLIDEEEAKKKRLELQKESEFYGAMDGAAKFVRGDASAGLIITLINILGGIVIGVLQMKMPVVKALETYTILTIGDGLVSQIPALIISTTSGLLVTKVSSETNIGQELAKQILVKPKAVGICAAMMALFGVMPGLPAVPFFSLAGIFGLISYYTNDLIKISQKVDQTTEKSDAKEKAKNTGPEKVEKYLEVDTMEIEIGYGLIPLVDAEQGGDLLDKISLIRRQSAVDMGVIVPPIRIRDNIQLKPNDYVIKIKGLEVARGELQTDYYLAMNGSDSQMQTELNGIPTKEPAFGLPAIWISEDQKDQAELAGFTVVDNSSVLSTHLTEVIKKSASQLLGKQDVQNLVDNIKEKYPAVVEDLIPGNLTVSQVHRILQNLLQEKVPIRDMVSIFEALSDIASAVKDIDALSEHVRRNLARSICMQYVNAQNEMTVMTLDPQLEQKLAESIQLVDRKTNLVIDPLLAQDILAKISQEADKMSQMNLQPVLLVLANVRLPLKRMAERFIPNLVILSYNEVLSDVQINNVGIVQVQNENENV